MRALKSRAMSIRERARIDENAAATFEASHIANKKLASTSSRNPPTSGEVVKNETAKGAATGGDGEARSKSLSGCL